MKAKQKHTKKPLSARTKTKKPVLVRSKIVARKPRTTRASTAKASAKVKTPVRVKIKHSTKKVLVPHKENDFRPHLIRLQGLVVALIIAVGAQMAYGFLTTGQVNVLGRVSDISTVDLLVDTNQQRASEGLPQLVINEKLSRAAFLKAQDMFANNYWAHTSPSGTQPWKWFGDVEYNYSYAGENLAKNYPTADATVAAWMQSPTHRANIMNAQYEDIGFAVVDGTLQGKATTLVVALYGTPVVAAVSGEVQAAQAGTFSSSLVSTSTNNPFEYFGSALRSLSPIAVAILGLLAVIAVVGIAAHHYRKQLPKAWQRSWRMHQGMYTFVGMILLGVLVIIASGGGSI